jgi:transketolase
MPSWELFAAQPASYQEQVLPKEVRARVSIEAAGVFGWSRWITDDGIALGLEGFGASAPGERLYQEFKLTPEHVVAAAKRLLSNTNTSNRTR